MKKKEEDLIKDDEPELRPDFIEGALKIDKEQAIKIGKVSDLRKRYKK